MNPVDQSFPGSILVSLSFDSKDFEHEHYTAAPIRLIWFLKNEYFFFFNKKKKMKMKNANI